MDPQGRLWVLSGGGRLGMRVGEPAATSERRDASPNVPGLGPGGPASSPDSWPGPASCVAPPRWSPHGLLSPLHPLSTPLVRRGLLQRDHTPAFQGPLCGPLVALGCWGPPSPCLPALGHLSLLPSDRGLPALTAIHLPSRGPAGLSLRPGQTGPGGLQLLLDLLCAGRERSVGASSSNALALTCVHCQRCFQSPGAPTPCPGCVALST